MKKISQRLKKTKILQTLIEEKGNNPIYQFGAGFENDPNSQTECIGDNAVKASTYGIRNLKIVEENLEQWICADGENYEDLKELHGELLGVWRRYLSHVSTNIGGMHKDSKKIWTAGPHLLSCGEIIPERSNVLSLIKKHFQLQNGLLTEIYFRGFKLMVCLKRLTTFKLANYTGF